MQVSEFKGNTTDQLWAGMGIQKNAQGVEQHGQSCWLYIHPTGTEETRVRANGVTAANVLEEMGGDWAGPIDEVMAELLQYSIICSNLEEPELYAGLRAGAGWCYGALAHAKALGATHAETGLHSNDGNMYVEAANSEKGIYVYAVHITYYGT